MSAAIPTTEPTQLRAGETLSFSRSLPDYPANASPAWAITYAFRGPGVSKIDFTSAASGSDHLVTVAFATTAEWKPGIYTGTGVVSNGTTKAQVYSGQLIVLPNLAAQEADFDARSQARRTLDNINAVLEGRASSTVLNSMVEGTKLERIPHEDLLKLRDYFQNLVNQERAAEAIANGKSTGRTTFARFTRPR